MKHVDTMCSQLFSRGTFSFDSTAATLLFNCIAASRFACRASEWKRPIHAYTLRAHRDETTCSMVLRQKTGPTSHKAMRGKHGWSTSPSHVAKPLHVLTKIQEQPCLWQSGRSIHWDGQACSPESVGIYRRGAAHGSLKSWYL